MGFNEFLPHIYIHRNLIIRFLCIFFLFKSSPFLVRPHCFNLLIPFTFKQHKTFPLLSYIISHIILKHEPQKQASVYIMYYKAIIGHLVIYFSYLHTLCGKVICHNIIYQQETFLIILLNYIIVCRIAL